MPIPQLPGILNDPNADINALVQGIRDYQIRLDRELQYMMQNGLDSTNLFEAGGFRVKPDTFMHKTGLVGMSSAGTTGTSIRFWAGDANPANAPFRVQHDGKLFASNADIAGKITATSGAIGGFMIGATSLTDVAGTFGLSSVVTAGDDVRFFAGNANPTLAPFRVTESGLATMIGALIQSATGYPRIELSSSGNLLAAYKTATDSLKINPNPTGSPSLIFDNGTISAIIGNTPTRFWIQGVTGIMKISANNDMEISSGGKVKFDAWSNILNGASNRTLQQDLDAKQNTISGATGSFTTVDGKTVSVSNGIVTSIV